MAMAGNSGVGQLIGYRTYTITPDDATKITITHDIGVRPKLCLVYDISDYSVDTSSTTYIVIGVFSYDAFCGAVRAKTNGLGTLGLAFAFRLGTNASVQIFTMTDTQVSIGQVSAQFQWNTSHQYLVELYY